MSGGDVACGRLPRPASSLLWLGPTPMPGKASSPPRSSSCSGCSGDRESPPPPRMPSMSWQAPSTRPLLWWTSSMAPFPSRRGQPAAF
ncbi:unnamed protein product [Symbiodinium microadriaticum]|nr:unnamed protein product [Symbiodinium microadriaticum]